MCGIAGIISKENIFDKSVINSMTESLSHRGPDAENIFISEDSTCYLGHRRLKIIDLSESANQPMLSSCGNFVIVYNGEVYNFKEIGQELEKSYQLKFKTNSDTEIILESYIKWGSVFVSKLNGMFAIAIYNIQSKALFLFRDRLGKKPIYYLHTDKFFAFASELKAIKRLIPYTGKFSLNIYAVNQFMRLGYIHEPHTIYTEVNKMKAASYVCLSNNHIHEEIYWSIHDKIKPNTIINEKQAKEELNSLLESSVNYRMVSDVPFGVFLSGGIDSSIVTAYAQSQSTTPINSFSIGFKEAKFNESKHARAVSKYLKTNHHEFEVSHTDAMELIEEICDIYDEPFIDTSSIPTLLVSKLAKKYVSMVLTGDGGDEQFLGYGMYTWAKRLNHPIVIGLKSPIAMALKHSRVDRLKRAAPLLSFSKETHMPSHIFSVEQYLYSDKEVSQVLNKEYTRPIHFENRTANARRLSVVEKQALFDIEHYLNGDLLVKVDRACMHYSLEARSPLLDYRIIEFSINLDETLKRKDNQSKYLLKSLLYEKVPKDLFDRPKWGFGIPFDVWLKSELSFLIEKYLNNSILKKYGIVDELEIQQLLKRYLGGENYLYNKVWAVLCLNIWLEKNQDSFTLN